MAESKETIIGIIEQINEKYKGDFTDANKVVINALALRL